MDGELLKQAAFKHREEIAQPFDELISLDGFEMICSLCNYFGGTTVYIPKLRSVFIGCLEREAVSEFDGFNLKRLVKKYEFSESHLRKLIHRSCVAKKNF